MTRMGWKENNCGRSATILPLRLELCSSRGSKVHRGRAGSNCRESEWVRRWLAEEIMDLSMCCCVSLYKNTLTLGTFMYKNDVAVFVVRKKSVCTPTLGQTDVQTGRSIHWNVWNKYKRASLPENCFVEVFSVCSVNFFQIAHRRQFVSKFAPRNMKDLISNVTLNNFHKMLHFMFIQLQLSKLNRIWCMTH